MKQRFIVTLLTVLVFAAGFAGGVWRESHRPLPPPPAALGAEFTTGQPSDKNLPPAQKQAAQNATKPYDRAQLFAEIEKLSPQIEAYRSRVDELDRECDAAFIQILNPEQRKVFDDRIQKHRVDANSKAVSPTPVPLTPLSEEEIAKLRQRPFENVYWKVVFTGRLEGTIKDFKLDDKQAAALRQILVTRREKFLALVDSLPPPTFRLTLLAREIQRLVDPAATPAPAAPVALPK